MGTCRTNAENIRIEPVYGSWEEQELFSVDCVADVADSLGGTYINFASTAGLFYAWFNTGASVDPAPAGRTGIAVAISTGATAAAVATALSAAVDANASFHASVDGCDATKVYIQVKAAGATLGAPADVDSGMTVTRLRVGAVLELGFFEGDLELALTESFVDVTSHQTGAQIIAALRNGRNIDNVSFTLKESDAAKLKAIIEASGVEYTPAGGTAVSAWGSEDTKSFGNLLSNARKLVLHPIRNAADDLSGDFCFFRAYPLLTGLTLSGETERRVSVDFKIMPDQLLVREARQFVYGDHSQKFLA